MPSFKEEVTKPTTIKKAQPNNNKKKENKCGELDYGLKQPIKCIPIVSPKGRGFKFEEAGPNSSRVVEDIHEVLGNNKMTKNCDAKFTTGSITFFQQM